jgi:hypothetical protein
MELKIDSLQDIKKLLEDKHDIQNRIILGYDEIDKEEQTTRQIGEKWFDSDGNEWEQKKGYKVKLGKVWQQELHQYLNEFTNCPKENCTCGFPKKLDEKMRRIHGMCFDCVIDMEHKIRLEGKWEEYEKTKLKENALAWLQDAEKDKNLIVDELSRLEFTNDFGDIEKWDTKVNKEELLKKIEDEFQTFKTDFIEKLEKDLENMNETE